MTCFTLDRHLPRRNSKKQEGVVESLTCEKEMRAAFKKTENQLDI